MDLLALVASFSVGATFIALLYAFRGNAMTQSANARGRLEGLMRGAAVIETGPVALKIRGGGKNAFAGFAPGNLGEQLQGQLERADMTIRPGEYICIRFAMAVVGVLLPLFVVDGWLAYLIGAVGAIIGYNLPKFYMNHRRKKRVDMLNAQLPEALSLISNSLKAGFGLLQALATAVDQTSHPISTEFARTIHEMNIGSSADVALNSLGDRAGSYDLDIVVTAILVQRSVGGNLGEILDNVAETMRERIRIRGEIATLTAQQKLTGIVIGLLPVGVGVLFQVMSPEYIQPLFTTMEGRLALVTAAVFETIGVMVIQRLLDIEV